jgi:hypothetical protein
MLRQFGSRSRTVLNEDKDYDLERLYRSTENQPGGEVFRLIVVGKRPLTVVATGVTDKEQARRQHCDHDDKNLVAAPLVLEKLMLADKNLLPSPLVRHGCSVKSLARVRLKYVTTACKAMIVTKSLRTGSEGRGTVMPIALAIPSEMATMARLTMEIPRSMAVNCNVREVSERSRCGSRMD